MKEKNEGGHRAENDRRKGIGWSDTIFQKRYQLSRDLNEMTEGGGPCFSTLAWSSVLALFVYTCPAPEGIGVFDP